MLQLTVAKLPFNVIWVVLLPILLCDWWSTIPNQLVPKDAGTPSKSATFAVNVRDVPSQRR